MTTNTDIVDHLTQNLHNLNSLSDAIVKLLEKYPDHPDFKDITKNIIDFINFNKECEQELQKFNTHSPNFAEFLTKKRHALRERMNVIKGFIEIASEESQLSLSEVKAHTGKILEAIARINIHIPSEKYTFEPAENSEEFINYKKKFAILLVDDVKDNCLLLQRYLKHFGYPNTQIANNGEQALDLIEKTTFDLMLLDIKMPGITGFDVLKELKDNIFQHQLSVIMITVSDDVKDALECIRMGAVDYLLKPFDVDRLRVHISSIVEKKWHAEKNKENIPLEQMEDKKQRHLATLNALWTVLNQTLPNPLPELVDTSQVPEPYRLWLDHTGLVLPKMEKYFGQSFEISFNNKNLTDQYFTKKTIFSFENQNVLISYMHINLSSFSSEVASEIIEGEKSLGRIITKANIEIDMLLHSLVKINNWKDIGSNNSLPVYGRLVTFFIKGKPALELLEIAIKRCQ